MLRKTVLPVLVALMMMAGAAPAAAPAPLPDHIDGISIEALTSLAPAIIGEAAGPAESTALTQESILTQAKQLAAAPGLPAPIRSILLAVIDFLDGSRGGGPKIPGNGPIIAQFLYPTVGRFCIGDALDSGGTALAVPGPAKLPVPGPGPGQAGFVFTALGTAPPTRAQPDPLTVTWLNLDNRRSQTQPLTNAAKINPGGPATLSAIADTGPGRVVAVISGGLTTHAAKSKQAPRSCSFLPTVGLFTVG